MSNNMQNLKIYDIIDQLEDLIENMTNFFLSIGMSKKAIFLSLTRQMLFLVPCLLILPRWFGTLGVWISIPIADTTATIVTALVLINQFRKFHSK